MCGTLETGEALVSFLDEKGAPSIVQRAKILFPLSQIGAVSDSQREQIIKQSRIYGKYDKAFDRESAFEVRLAQAEKDKKAAEEAQKEAEAAKKKATADKAAPKSKKTTSTAGKVLSTMATTATREITRGLVGGTGKKSSSGGLFGAFVRGIMGNLLK